MKLEQLISTAAKDLRLSFSDSDLSSLDSPGDSLWPLDSQVFGDRKVAAANSVAYSRPQEQSKSHQTTEPTKLAETMLARNINHNEQTAFEYLSQHGLRLRAKYFNDLSPREQALAKVGGLLHLFKDEFVQSEHHFFSNNILIAKLDRQHKRFYMLTDPPAMDFSEMSHTAGTQAAGAVSDEFEVLPVLDAVWMYGQHDPEALLDLPSNMGVKWLQLCRVPVISQHYMTTRHLQLIRRLLVHPLRFESLRKKATKAQLPALLSDLATLFLTQSLVILNHPFPISTKVAQPSKVFVR